MGEQMVQHLRSESQPDEACAGGVVFHGGQILILQKRNREWVLPKGHVEPGETHAEAAIREVREETGVKAQIVGQLKPTSYRFFKRNGREISKRVSWFLMEAEQDPWLRWEGIFVQVCFVHSDEALKILTFASDRDLVRAALRRRDAMTTTDEHSRRT